MSRQTVTAADIRNFSEFCRNASDDQLRGIYDKETKAGREAFAALAELEAQRRGLFWL